MALKITLFFSQFSRGWTETWYSNTSGLPFNVDAPTRQILQDSIAFRGLGTVISAIRFTTEEASPKSVTVPLGDTYKAIPTYNLDPGDPDMVTTTAVYRFFNIGGVRKRVFFRGMQDKPDARDGKDGADIVDPFVDKQIKQMGADAFNAGWTIRQIQSPKNSALAYQPVKNISPDPANNNHSIITFTGGQPFTVTPTTFARFARINHNDLPGFPRTAQVLDVSPGPTITIAYRLRGGAAYAPVKMKLIPLAYNYVPWNQVIFERYSEHKTGRPFGLLRGRLTAAVKAV